MMHEIYSNRKKPFTSLKMMKSVRMRNQRRRKRRSKRRLRKKNNQTTAAVKVLVLSNAIIAPLPSRLPLQPSLAVAITLVETLAAIALFQSFSSKLVVAMALVLTPAILVE